MQSLLAKPNLFNFQSKFLSLAMACCLGWIPLTANANHSAQIRDDFDPSTLQKRVYQAIEKTMPAVVAVQDRSGTFSAVIISEDGLVLSAGHAVRPNRSYQIHLSDGRKARAIGLGVNEEVDCAMLQITQPGPWPKAEMGDSYALVKNQPCVSISHPGRFDPKRGPVVRLGYVIDPMSDNGMIQSTAKMEPGDSGGPLVDLQGRVIGIHSNIRRTVDRNYDVPIAAFKKNWDQLKTKGEFKSKNWPSLPKLGFQVQQSDSENGLEVTRVDAGGMAAKAGLKLKDEIVAIADRRVEENADAARMFRRLAISNANRVPLKVIRERKVVNIELKIPHDHSPAIPELANLEDFFKPLESKLDDKVVLVRSTISGDDKRVWGTRILSAGGGNIISKSSLVGDSPRVTLGRQTVSARIIKRDPKNDLVLLFADLANTEPQPAAVNLSFLPGDMATKQGKFLLTPDANGPGFISVWGSKYFQSQRTRQSSGYLGVEVGIKENGGNEVYFKRVVDKLAADAAGLEPGDILLKLDDQRIKKRNDVFSFLSTVDAYQRIKVLISRDGNQLEKQVVLGRRPESSRHVADQLPGGKSGRQDGFELVLSHDGDVRPEQCGGPVFDAFNGDFLGINMARNSRTRCYVVPKSVLEKFVNH